MAEMRIARQTNLSKAQEVKPVSMRQKRQSSVDSIRRVQRWRGSVNANHVWILLHDLRDGNQEVVLVMVRFFLQIEVFHLTGNLDEI